MSLQQLFYVDAKPVSAAAHQDLYIKAGRDYAFAAKVNAVPLTAGEFPLAAAEYVIVFAGADDAVMPLALLGTQPDSNLYVDAAGNWNARYIPAFVRRYPFVFAQGADARSLVLCIDEDYAGCNRDGRGERLFDADAERTAYLHQVLGFLKAYQQQYERTRGFCRKIAELNLLSPVQAILTPPGAARQVLGGLRVVDRQRLKALDTETVMALLKGDELELAFLQLHSLANLRTLGERMPRPQDASAAEVAGFSEDEGVPVRH